MKSLMMLFGFFDNLILKVFEPVTYWLQIKTKKTTFGLSRAMNYFFIAVFAALVLGLIIYIPKLREPVTFFWYSASFIYTIVTSKMFLNLSKIHEKEVLEGRDPKIMWQKERLWISLVNMFLFVWIIISRISGDLSLNIIMCFLIPVGIIMWISFYLKSCKIVTKKEGNAIGKKVKARYSPS